MLNTKLTETYIFQDLLEGDTNTNTNTNMYNKNLSERDLYLAGLVGGWREGAGVKEGSERARPQ